MQQLFVELVLKKEQEVYASEGMNWVNIQFFNNKLICDMIDTPSVVSHVLYKCFKLWLSVLAKANLDVCCAGYS